MSLSSVDTVSKEFPKKSPGLSISIEVSCKIFSPSVYSFIEVERCQRIWHLSSTTTKICVQNAEHSNIFKKAKHERCTNLHSVVFARVLRQGHSREQQIPYVTIWGPQQISKDCLEKSVTKHEKIASTFPNLYLRGISFRRGCYNHLVWSRPRSQWVKQFSDKHIKNFTGPFKLAFYHGIKLYDSMVIVLFVFITRFSGKLIFH